MGQLCLALGLVSLAISLALVRALIAAGGRLGGVDVPGAEAHKQHERAVPTTGGIGIFWAIAGPMIAGLAAVWLLPADAWTGTLEPIREHLPGLRAQTPLALATLGAMAVMHVTGLIDDRRRLGPGAKLTVQLLVAAVLAVFFEMRVLVFLESYGPAGFVASVVLSVLWIAVITNAMNMLDNMDGLSSGVGAIIAGLYLAATLVNGQWFVAALCALLLGALLGFLVFNFPPARVFMGDGGSLVLGVLLAIISVRTTYTEVHSPDIHRLAGWYGLLMPLLVMAVPLYDFVSVTLIRTLEGRSPFTGDRNHFSHRLVRKGLSTRSAVIVIWLTTLATGLGGVILGNLAGWQAAIVAAQCAVVLAVLILLERGR